jgi:hypothetical protein
MGDKRINLSGIALDDAGRAVLSDDALEGIEAHLETPSAGGLNGYCPDSSNRDCFNSTNCQNSSNETYCTNQTQCGGASNHRACYEYPI